MAGDEAPGSPPRHRLTQRQFDLLASGHGDPDTVSGLLAAERSWRLVQLRAVLDALRVQPGAAGDLPPVETAWELLARAERQSPSEVDKLLLHPQVGTWAGYTLRRLRGSAAAESPLWVDVGYLHALAAAAAIRARLDFSILVPVRDGFAMLPTMGAVRLAVGTPWGLARVSRDGRGARVTGGGHTVEIRAEGGSGWVPLPTVRVEWAGQTLAVTVDSLDPYRNLRTPMPPQPLTVAQARHWHLMLERAWRRLVEVCPQWAAPIARGLSSVVPAPPAERFRTMSASAGDAFGSMIVSELRDATELAVTMVHEFQHIKLGGVLHLAPLQQDEPQQRLYAPWRDDPRPLGGLLQGVYAFTGITEFWRALRQVEGGTTGRLAQFEFARWRRQVWATLRLLRDLPQLTEVGRRLATGLTATATGWWEEDVPADLRAAADAVVLDHRVRWRVHHLRPDRAAVAALAGAWLSGVARPAQPDPAPAVEADPSARGLDARAVLTLWRETDPDGFAHLCRQPADVGAHVTGAGVADLWSVAGERERARERYLAEIATPSEDAGAWAGLAVTAAGGPAATALRSRPELVRAVHWAVRERTGAPVDPLALAAWIGGAAS